MRRLAGVFGDQEPVPARAMSKPFKLAAYVDRADDGYRPPSALANVLFVALGVTAASVCFAPSILQNGTGLDEYGLTPTPPDRLAGRPSTRFGAPPTLAESPVFDSHLTMETTELERPLPVVIATEAAGVSDAAATRVVTDRAIPVNAPGRIPANYRTSIPIRSPLTDLPREPAASAAVRLAPRRDVARPVVPIEVPEIAESKTGRDGGIAGNDLVQFAEPSAETRAIPADTQPPATAQLGLVERSVGVADPAAPRQTSRGVEFEVGTSFNGVAGGRIALLLEDSMLGKPDRVSENISVRLGDIINLLAPRMDPALLGWMTSSEHVGQYLTLNDLRAHGISVSFDAKDRLVFRAM